MKHLIRNIFALVLSAVLIMAMSTVVFAADNTINTEDEISAVLAKINAEYGTNIHKLTDSELAKYGMTDAEPQDMAYYDHVDLEETLRYIAEVKIPQFERTSQEAISTTECLGIDLTTMDLTTSNDSSVRKADEDPIIATKPIDYALAGAQAYITKDSYGNTVWGSVVTALCYSNMYQDIWFMTYTPSVTHIDGRRTLYWTGTGDYFAYINGVQYYLYTGAQYAEMYVGNYV